MSIDKETEAVIKDFTESLKSIQAENKTGISTKENKVGYVMKIISIVASGVAILAFLYSLFSFVPNLTNSMENLNKNIEQTNERIEKGLQELEKKDNDRAKKSDFNFEVIKESLNGMQENQDNNKSIILIKIADDNINP